MNDFDFLNILVQNTNRIINGQDKLEIPIKL